MRTRITLETPRLRLEPIRRRHAPLLFDALSDPTIYTFMPTVAPGAVADLEARYARLEARRSPDGREVWLNWAVCLRATGEYVGTTQATVRPDATALLAYELTTSARGQGFAGEACRAVIAELFDGYEVERILAYVDTRNGQSIRLLERLGFERIDHLPHADHFKGAWSDEYVYALARPLVP